MGRPSNRTERRAEILDAMAGVVAEVGYERASIAAIAEAAGLRQGLLHYHFESKQEMLLALIARMGDRVRARAPAAKLDAPEQRILALVDAYLAKGEGEDRTAVRCWVALSSEALHLDEVRSAYAAAVGEAIRELSSAYERAGLGARAAKTAGAAVWAAIDGALRLGLTAPGALPEGTAAPAVRAMAAALLSPPAARALAPRARRLKDSR